MQYSAFRVSPFPRKIIFSGVIPVKIRSIANDLPDSLGAFLYDNLNDLLITQAISGNKCIADMLFKRIRLISNSSNPSLGILGIRLVLDRKSTRLNSSH